MMTDKRTRKQWMIAAVVLAVLVYSAAGIDYSGLAYFSPSMAGDVFRGLAKPAWGYVYDGSGEDLISLLLLTLGIAFLGTAIATVLALPITLLSSANLWRSCPWVSKAGKSVCNVLRAFPELVYQIGMLGKLYTEEMEAMEESPVEAMTAVGAGFWQTMFFARIPQLMPIYSSLSLNHFEIAVRSASTLGLVGAGGIGAPLVFAIQARNWDKVSVILMGVIVAVFAIDSLAGFIRKKLK